MIDQLIDWGVRDILVNTHHQPDCIVDAIRGNATASAHIEVSFEPEILGTGGALKRASWFLDNEPFWIANTDIACDLSPVPFLHCMKQNPLAALWMHPTRGPRTVEVQNGIVKTFRSSTPGATDTFTFCGLQLVSPDIMALLPEKEEFCSLVDLYEKGQARGMQVHGVVEPKSFWEDLGTPTRYVEAHGEILNRYRQGLPGKALMDPTQVDNVERLRQQGVDAGGFVATTSYASIAKGARVHNSILCDGVSLASDAVIRSSVLASCENAYHGRADSCTIVPCSQLPGQSQVHHALRYLKWPAKGTTFSAFEARGSNRQFGRMQRGSKRVILVEYDHVREENRRFASHTRFLAKHGVNVPALIASFPSRMTDIIEDVGGRSLQQEMAQATPRRQRQLYTRTLDQLATLHAIPPSAIRPDKLEPPFCADLYAWEHDLLTQHILRGKLDLAPGQIAPILRELGTVSSRLEKVRPVLLHRDMQSSNVLLRRGRPVLIDYQGLRRGPAAYDVASLLCDPYIMLNEDSQLNLLAYYLERIRRPETVASVFWHAAVQRLAQALGAFGRLSALPQTTRFSQFIEPAANMMLRALSHLDPLPHLDNAIQRLTP